MDYEMLKKAREYELNNEVNIAKESRPLFHLSSRVGWMNDPNGFSLYKGKYHLFYQYYPYDTKWGPMHWAHAVSEDFLDWKYLPVALAPDMPYDDFGCFSGTAITTADDKHLLMYTCVKNHYDEAGKVEQYQQQAVALGDGYEYVKSDQNPVISTEQIPEGYSPLDFRDPKIWLGKDGVYRALIGAMDKDGLGVLLLYTSCDCINWTYKKEFIRNDGQFGKMWECPDFFVLDGKGVVIVSPTDMLADGYEHLCGNGTLCLIGSYDETSDEFIVENTQSIDYGIDFYAPESLETKDGRRVMIAWMQNWDTISDKQISNLYFGQMTIARELSIKDGRLYQKPVSELESIRTDEVVYRNVVLENSEIELARINGRTIEMDVEIRPSGKGELFDKFVVFLAKNDKYYTTFSYLPKEGVVEIDRTFAGSRRAIVHQKKTLVDNRQGELKAKFVLDRYSIEIFIENGLKAITFTIPTELNACDILFKSIGNVEFDVKKYSIFLKM